jgi:hypothetical protein
MPVRLLPECAGYTRCGVAVPQEQDGRRIGWKPCPRRARFLVESPGQASLNTCSRHVQTAVMQQVLTLDGARRHVGRLQTEDSKAAVASLAREP